MTKQENNNGLFSGDQHLNELDQAVYIDWLRKKGPTPQQTLLDHVGICEDCKAQIIAGADLMDVIEKEGLVIKKQRRLIFLRSVAAMIIIVLTALAIQFLRPKSPDTEMADNQNDSIEIERKDSSATEPVRNELHPVGIMHDTIRYAARFTPNMALDAIVEARFRGQGAHISFSLPTDTLLWCSAKTKIYYDLPDEASAQFILLNNRANTVETLELSAQESLLSLDYQPGLYYWRLLLNNELIQAGRIKILNKLD